MRRLLILGLLLSAAPGWAAIAATANHGNATVTSGTIQATLTINSGDTVIVGILVNDAGKTITSVCDGSGTNQCTGGNTYSQQATNDTNCSHACQVFLWASCNVSNSATAVSVVVNGTFTRAYVDVQTYTGVGTNCFGNTGSQGSAASGSISCCSPSISTQDANNFVVEVGAQSTATQPTFTASTGSLRDQLTTATGGIGVNDNTSASAGAVTNSFTSNKAGSPYNAVAVELRSTNGGGGGGTAVRHKSQIY